MSESCKYLIIGGGIAADAAVRGIRRLDNSGSITVLCGEKHPPYDRPPLSKKLWTGKPLDSIWHQTEAAGAILRLGVRALTGDPDVRSVRDDVGNTYIYEKLLIATGGSPRRLGFADDGVTYFRTIDDYEHVRTLADRGAKFIVLGGGFIGSEIAAALATKGCPVSMIFPAASIGAHFYPPALSAFVNDLYRQKGITVITRDSAKSIEKTIQGMTVSTAGGRTLSADGVIAGIGIQPELGLARSMGLATDNGIVVDEQLRTTRPDIYAAGDVANFFSTALGVRRRVEHEDNALAMGAMAGRNMAGNSEKYEHLPYFYSDLFDLGYEAVGEMGGDLEVVEDWKERFRKGVIYYLRDSKVRGVLLWNTWGQVDAARKLIANHEPIDEHSLRGRISD